jgi:hypothetical protein
METEGLGIQGMGTDEMRSTGVGSWPWVRADG